ncbi:MAG TPA: tRNA (adenosine(37)-N6)-threonylcarbamoyltransferase complex transferase subunit TsaD [Candidatus Saccharimonadales bacterium]|nr:tRNA (adenosine(37)-N6)-threonylcarbamoyltransferase complex transferase subunit TsaD [Candidatus Saccharimonadales bacterium]
MLTIGLESSAHTFGVGVADNGKILSNEKAMYRIGGGGMIPAEVAETHIANAEDVIGRALDSAGISTGEIEGVGYTMGPGMGPCLQVAQLAAKTLASRLKVRIVPVNHCVAHAEIARRYGKLRDPVMLYVSGGNSQILTIEGKPFRHYSVAGETFDIGIGNMLDSFARNMHLVPAWGSSIEKNASGGRYIPLPYTVKGMDFSFTGLLTRSTELIPEERREDLCFSIQETAFSAICEATERAMLLKNKGEIGICGGVAQNSRLRSMLGLVAKEHGASFGYAPDEFNADNGGMIAFVAEKMLKEGMHTPVSRCEIRQRYRTDLARLPSG